MTYKEFINQVKEIVHSQPIPPNYNPDDYSDKSFNCYLYALQICIDCPKDFIIEPGFMSNRSKCTYTKEYILEHFKEDCELLGLRVLPSSELETIETNEYKIAVYFINDFGFHFARQDSNGNWSEKPGWLKNIRMVKSVTENENGFKLIGIFRVSKKE